MTMLVRVLMLPRQESMLKNPTNCIRSKYLACNLKRLHALHRNQTGKLATVEEVQNTKQLNL
jgi:hypothetical protein